MVGCIKLAETLLEKRLIFVALAAIKVTTVEEIEMKRTGAAVDTTGSEFRCDPLTGRWTLIAEGRVARPTNLTPNKPTENATVALAKSAPSQNDASAKNAGSVDSFCPFCPGSESMTPRVVMLATRRSVENGDENESPSAKNVDENESPSAKNVDAVDGRFVFRDARTDVDVEGARWNVRVFENKYPAFRPSEYSDVEAARALDCARGTDAAVGWFFQSFRGVGRHEVIVDSERHLRGWSDFSDDEIEVLFQTFRRRLKTLRDSRQYAFSFVFKNVGSDAGASQGHSHCQLTATAILPPDLRREVDRLIRYERGRRERGESASFWDALLDAELKIGVRIVSFSDRFVAYCPFASRFPMEVEICPRFDGDFEDYDDDALAELARTARDLVVALERSKRKTSGTNALLDYNVIMKNAPSLLDVDLAEGVGLYRPRWTILPSLVKKAGYEWGSGVDINPVAPETAAARLRDALRG